MHYNSLGPKIIVTTNKNPSVLISYTCFVNDRAEIYKVGDCVMINRVWCYGTPEQHPPYTTLHEFTSIQLRFGEIGIVLNSFGNKVASDPPPYYTVLMDRQRIVSVYGAHLTKVNNSQEIEAAKRKDPLDR